MSQITGLSLQRRHIWASASHVCALLGGPSYYGTWSFSRQGYFL